MVNTAFDAFFGQFPNLVGFDAIAKQLSEVQKASMKAVNYPPYNVKKVDENKYVIELAVAGFGKQDIELELKDKVLSIKGNVNSDEKDDPLYLYKGIANRAFTRQFTIADQVEIQNAELINGMLKIWLENVAPKPTSRKIDINEKKERSL
jgi:molecular chaperone IbpA